MTFDAETAAAAVGAELPESVRRWGADDVILYHLGVGAGPSAPGPRPLRYVYERDLVVLPGFAATVAHATGTAVEAIPGLGATRRMTVHGEQSVTLLRPLPVEAEARTTGRVAEVTDRGSFALLGIETETHADGELLFRTRFGIALRGAGGFGGPAPRPSVVPIPADGQPPDHRLRIEVSPRQAAIYRLLGDRNPLHVDPEHARAVGFTGPIVHGLSTYGAVLRALIDELASGDVTTTSAFRARFAGPVYPGDVLEVDAWEVDGGYALTARVPERDGAVLTRGFVALRRP